MKISLGKKTYQWQPHWVVTLIVLVMAPFLLSLAYWQYQRSLYKEELMAQYAASQSAESIRFEGSTTLPLPEFQPISIEGRLDPNHLFFVDNTIYQGRAGYEVLLPFQLKDSQEWLLVNLGWMPRNPNRSDLPSFPLPSTDIKLTGRSDFPSNEYLLLGTYLEAVGADKNIIQAVDLERMSEALGHPLLPIVLLADPDPNSSLVRDWEPQAIMTPEKHQGYAVQWTLLAITLMVLYIVFSTRKS